MPKVLSHIGVFVIGFMLVGIVWLASSQASTGVTVVEAEDATVSESIDALVDDAASGDAITFTTKEVDPLEPLNLVDVKPFTDRLAAVKTDHTKVTAILQDYQDTREEVAKAAGFTDAKASKVGITYIDGEAAQKLSAQDPDVFGVTFIDTSLPSHVERYWIYAYAYLDSMARVPTSIWAETNVSRTIFVYSVNGLSAFATCNFAFLDEAHDYRSCTTESANVFGIKDVGFTDDGKVNLGYHSHRRGITHELGHTWSYRHLPRETWLKDYPKFTAANPEGFTNYGDTSQLRIDARNNPVGFTRVYASTTLREDMADVFAYILTNGYWGQARSRALGLNNYPKDTHLRSKITILLAEMKETEPALSEQVLNALEKLPNYVPTP